MMDALAIQAAEDFAQAGYPREARAVLLCELDGTVEEVEQHIDRVSAIFNEYGASSLRVSQNEEERALLWKGRKSAFPAIGPTVPEATEKSREGRDSCHQLVCICPMAIGSFCTRKMSHTTAFGL